MVCDTLYLQNEGNNPQFFLPFWHTLIALLKCHKLKRKSERHSILGANVLYRIFKLDRHEIYCGKQENFYHNSRYMILSRRHTWRFYTPIAANLIVSENRERNSPVIDADTLGDFLRRSRRFGSSIPFPDYNQVIFRDRVRHFEKSCDKIAQPDWLTLVAFRSEERTKSRERAH